MMQIDLLNGLNFEDPLPTASGLARGVMRALRHMGYAALAEFPIRQGRRVDMIGLNAKGHIVVVEIKSSVADFRSDAKWQDYLPYCDSYYFAVGDAFPEDILPAQHGLLIGDAFEMSIARHPSDVRDIKTARRHAVIKSFAIVAAQRLMRTQLDQSNIDIT